jgi:surfactin synthase thioesterase subunit
MKTTDHRSTAFFPGAGSFGREFQRLTDELKPAAWVVRYPGRYGKDFGQPAASFDSVVRACAEQVADRADAAPVLFGHSYGAYVAYATAVRLQETGLTVAALIATGASAPSQLRVPQQATQSPADAASYLDSIDPGMLDDAPSDDWREVVADTTAADLRLLREFGAATGGPAAGGLHCPVLAVRGEEDPLTSAAAIGEWQRYTDAGFAAHGFPGGHSDFLGSAACASACMSWIAANSREE